MKIVYGKTLEPNEELTVREIADSCGIMNETARLLFCRNQNTVDKVKRFLSPSKKYFYDPSMLNGIKDAVDRITYAKEHNQNVLVFGDYDADGVCATTIMFYALKEFGITPRIYVPERDEGYGLNVDTVNRLAENERIDLLITVDCGISDAEKIEQLKNLGLDVIVTDHHEPPEILPDCIKINPKIDGQDYPFKGLCGAGVAYKLACALTGQKADTYLDFVALATVADSMDLVDENRDIVSCGLKLFNDEKHLRLPFKYLLGDGGKAVTSQTLAYAIAPRINAGGRMGDANTALKLFTESDPNKVFDLAVKLNEYNIQRQVECDNIYNEAKARITKYSLYKKDVILVKDKNWSTGFIGIVAAKLVEDFARPVIVFAGHDDFLKGSARSVDGVNIHDAIAMAKDLLLGFGGHSQAAGVSVSEKNFAALDRALNAIVKREYGKVDTEQKIYVEWNVKEISPRFAHEIDMLEPFGVGNKRPVFTMEIGSVESLPLRSGSVHYGFKCNDFDMLDFNGEKHVETLKLPIKKNVVFEVNLSTFKGREYVKGYVRAICPNYDDVSALNLHILENELHKMTCDSGKAVPFANLDEVRGSGFGTLYVITDPKNLYKYPELLKLNVSVFEPERDKFYDCVVVSPKTIPEGFNRVVYLDKPLYIFNGAWESFVTSEQGSISLVENLSVERDAFSECFAKIKALTGKLIKSSADFALKHFNEKQRAMGLFAMKVFIELGIFSTDKGVLVFNENVKNALTNSKVYSKIVLLKGQYV